MEIIILFKGIIKKSFAEITKIRFQIFALSFFPSFLPSILHLQMQISSLPKEPESFRNCFSSSLWKVSVWLQSGISMLDARETSHRWGHPSMLAPLDTCDPPGSRAMLWWSCLAVPCHPLAWDSCPGHAKQMEVLPNPWLTASTETFHGEQDCFHISLLNHKAQAMCCSGGDSVHKQSVGYVHTASMCWMQ